MEDTDKEWVVYHERVSRSELQRRLDEQGIDNINVVPDINYVVRSYDTLHARDIVYTMLDRGELDSPCRIIYLWQPIAAAPKDGSLVFAWRTGWDRPAWVRWILNPRTKTEFWNDADELDAYEYEEHPPTHWLPLPAPPTENG